MARKKWLGFGSKTRKPEDVSKDYNENAIMAGHKAYQVQQLHTEAEKLQAEIQEHLRVMNRAKIEAAAIPPAARPAPAAADQPSPAKPQEVTQ